MIGGKHSIDRVRFKRVAHHIQTAIENVVRSSKHVKSDIRAVVQRTIDIFTSMSVISDSNLNVWKPVSITIHREKERHYKLIAVAYGAKGEQRILLTTKSLKTARVFLKRTKMESFIFVDTQIHPVQPIEQILIDCVVRMN